MLSLGTHASELWQLRRGPAWLRGSTLARKDASRLVDACVNANAALRPTRGELAAQNLAVLVERARRQGFCSLVDRLRSLADSPGTVIDPAKRSAFARKWADRIETREPASLHAWRGVGS